MKFFLKLPKNLQGTVHSSTWLWCFVFLSAISLLTRYLAVTVISGILKHGSPYSPMHFDGAVLISIH